MPSKLESRARKFVQGLFLMVLSLCGCARQPAALFTSSERVRELPELHQKNIEEGLRKYFGSPTQPHIALPTSSVDQSTDNSADTADESDEANANQEIFTDIVDRRLLTHGGTVYRNRCAGCHGLTGDGLGDAAAYLQPKPRDYRPGVFKFTSTPYGSKPTRQDLVRTIRRGAKGTSMPAFPWMSEEDLDAVVEYVIYLSQRGEVEQFVAGIAEDEYDEEEELESFDFVEAVETIRERWTEAEPQAIIPVSARPTMDQSSIEMGREIFTTENCWSCHGKDGKGQTEWLSQEFLDQQQSAAADKRIEINYDRWGHPAPAADLTARMLHGGRRPIDIYRRIYTGINGTPMPSFGDVFASDPDKIWHLVHYVLYIIEGGDPTMTQPAEATANESTSQEPAVTEPTQVSAGVEETEAETTT